LIAAKYQQLSYHCFFPFQEN